MSSSSNRRAISPIFCHLRRCEPFGRSSALQKESNCSRVTSLWCTLRLASNTTFAFPRMPSTVWRSNSWARFSNIEDRFPAFSGRLGGVDRCNGRSRGIGIDVNHSHVAIPHSAMIIRSGDCLTEPIGVGLSKVCQLPCRAIVKVTKRRLMRQFN